MSQIVQKLRPCWLCIDNYTSAKLGRIWLLYDSRVNILVFHKSSQAIHCHVFSVVDQKYFFLSVIYSSNCDIKRRFLWAELSTIKAQASLVPWLVVSDFNVIKTVEERSDYYQGMCSSGPSLDFQNCLHTLEFMDLHHSEPLFT